MTLSNSRSKIFENINNSLIIQGNSPSARKSIAQARIAARKANTVPVRAQGSARENLALFIAEAERVDATTICLDHADEVPGAVAAYLSERNLPARLKAAPRDLLENVAWAKQPMLDITFGPSAGDDEVGLSVAFAGVAETGTLVLRSGPDDPTTLNFLPDHHLVVLPRSVLLGTYEAVWSLLADREKALPRTVNWITGPSRSADIEQTLLMGAHGPRFLHILILDDKKNT